MFNHCPPLSVVSSISHLRHGWEWESFSSQPSVCRLSGHFSTQQHCCSLFFTFMHPPDGAPAGCFVPRRRLHPPAANVHLLHSWRSAAPKGKKKVVCSFATFKDETIHSLPEVKCSLYEFVSRLMRPSHRNRRKLRLKSTFIGCWLFWKPQAHRWRSWQTQ